MKKDRNSSENSGGNAFKQATKQIKLAGGSGGLRNHCKSVRVIKILNQTNRVSYQTKDHASL